MSNQEPLPLTGFALAKVYAGELTFKGVPVNDSAMSDDSALTIGWDWSFRSATEFDVTVSLRIEPSKPRPEQALASLTGIFRKQGESSVTLQRFVQFHAPAILLPFVREAIASLTGRGLGDSYVLPPINVLTMMRNMEAAEATGMKQIREGHEYAAAFGEVAAEATKASST